MTVKYPPFGIEIDGGDLPAADRSHYEASVKWHLDLINRSQTGRALLEAIRSTGKGLSIQPWLKTDVNATASARDMRGATAAGEYVIGDQNRPMQGGSWAWKGPIVGTGQGSKAVVRYSPSMFGFGGSGAATAPPTAAGTGPTAVLFHEMCHAYRIMRGTQYSGATMGGRAGYDDEEEFFAILVSNVFVSDPSTQVQVRILRADHHGFATLAANRATSTGFLQDAANQRLMVKLFTSEPGLANALRAVPAGFNPVRQYFGAPAP